jgi:phosphatidylglycerophosphate synthase
VTILERPVAEVSVDGPAVGLTTQVAVLAVLASGVGLGSVGWLTGVAYAIVVWATLTLAVRRAALRTFGAANWVTLARAILVGGVTALVTNLVVTGVQAGGLHRPGTAMVILIALSAVALALDGVDGQVARRTGTTSALGARFDMEVDAFLILVLSVFVAEQFGPWVLAIGAMRYAFVAAAWALPWLKGDLPPRLSRKAVAALQGIILVVAATGLLPTWATVGVVALALASLCWSFGRDVRWLWRTRRSSVTTGVAGPTTLSGDALHIDRLVHLAS